MRKTTPRRGITSWLRATTDEGKRLGLRASTGRRFLRGCDIEGLACS